MLLFEREKRREIFPLSCKKLRGTGTMIEFRTRKARHRRKIQRNTKILVCFGSVVLGCLFLFLRMHRTLYTTNPTLRNISSSKSGFQSGRSEIGSRILPEDMIDAASKSFCAKDELNVDYHELFYAVKNGTDLCRLPTPKDGPKKRNCQQCRPPLVPLANGKTWRNAVARHQQLIDSSPHSLKKIILLGDSIFEYLEGRFVGEEKDWHKEKYDFAKEIIEPEGGIIMGIAMDHIANLLYRIEEGGELPHIQVGQPGEHPDKLVLLIGTNDLTAMCSRETVLIGILNLVMKVAERRPKTTIVLHGLLPRPVDQSGKLYQSDSNGYSIFGDIEWINRRLECFATGTGNLKLAFFDATKYFIDDGDLIRKDRLPDNLHPSVEGYRAWIPELLKFLQTV